jgi:ATP-dependent DNA helicase DinG
MPCVIAPRDNPSEPRPEVRRAEQTAAPGPAPAASVSIVRATDDFFCPGGVMAKAGKVADFEYEPRPQQREMAIAVAEAIDQGRHLAVEAGTGVGKSLAYLVPAILAALARKEKVVVSTHTISLQEQLIHKDIPFLQQHLGREFKAVLVKGRSNYLCLRRLARAERMGPDLFASGKSGELERLREWSRVTKDGTLQELEEQPPSEIWNAVNVEHGNCLWHRCPEYDACFVMKARRLMREADLLVVNHHLFFSDLGLKEQGVGVLPACEMVILDEAHQVEAVSGEHLGVRLSQLSFERWMRRLYVPDSNRGLLAVLQQGQAAHAIVKLQEELDDFFPQLRKWAGFHAEKSCQVAGAPPDIPSAIPSLLLEIGQQLQSIHDDLQDLDKRAELMAARRRGMEMLKMFDAFMAQSLPDQVYWVASEGARRAQTVLYSAPIEVAPILRDTLFKTYRTVIMTSATLAVEGRLDYFRERVGADDAATLSVGSPFDYERQMRIIVPRGLPDPTQTEAYTEATAREVMRYVERTKGHAFVLFTSDRFMRAIRDRVGEYFEDRGYPLLMQGEGLPRHAMLDRFRSRKGSVLFGLDSFWMGVDVRGEALSNVIITRLPFAVPDEPLVKARMDRIIERGGDAFRDYSLPEAVLRFRQGVGRLIRSSTDTGIIVILDSRVLTKWYGKHFLKSLPECPVEIIED